MTITDTAPPAVVRKRDGREVPFDQSKITAAVEKCFLSVSAESGEVPQADPENITHAVVNLVAARHPEGATVEQVQDAVEHVLQASGEFTSAKHYILYRARHAEQRKVRPVPPEVAEAFEADKRYFPTPIQQFQFYDKYSRFNWEAGRRETWVETVNRTVAYLHELAGDRLDSAVYEDIRQGILNMQVMPSMRLLSQAGDSARRNGVSIYNCAYLPVGDVEAFTEALLISMAGCGVGYSVEGRYVEQFPRVQRQKDGIPMQFTVPDTTEGWAEALATGMHLWFEGEDVTYDYSEIRPAGSFLRVKGGRASGPEPLRAMLNYVRGKMLSRQGTFLRTIDAHDMMCVVGNAAVSGGTRRTAMLSLFDFHDHDMRDCKTGANLDGNKQRWNANNSAVWPDDITQPDAITMMLRMVESQRGEPGIFSRLAANRTKPERRAEAEFGVNPCGEINLRPYQFCNLTQAVARQGDTFMDLHDKVRLATIIGTIQSLATNFPGLRPDWKRNCEEERLLGVDISAQMDCSTVQDASILGALQEVVRRTNVEFADRLSINVSAATTCNKPNGNSSEFVNGSAGLHARWDEFYLRNARVMAGTPIHKVLVDAGVPMSPENGQTRENATTWVIHFPVKAPDGAVLRRGRGAIEQMDYWLMNKQHWTEHNPSCTISYKPDEVIDLMAWVWDHREVLGGISFLPIDDAHYDLLPYQTITKDEYERRLAEFPAIDFSKVYRYEEEDMTTSAQEVACSAGGDCETI